MTPLSTPRGDPGALIRLLRAVPGLRRLVYWFRLSRIAVRQRLLWCRLTWADMPNIREAIRFGLAVGRRYRDAVDPGRVCFADTAGRERVDPVQFLPHPDTAVILGVGQSNIANEGAADARQVPGAGVFNFNFIDARCYVARDPLLGASLDRSNLLTRLGDRLVRSGAYARVLLVPIAHGGSYASDWAPGGRLNLRLMMTFELLHAMAVAPTHILWQQGEAEGALGEDGDAWARAFDATVQAIRHRGIAAPLYVAQCTVCCSGPSAAIRAAQRGVVDAARGILAGPDLDVIGLDERWDGCHFGASGLDKAAELWFEIIAPKRRPAASDAR